MEENPDFGDVDVAERPKDEIAEGTVSKVRKGTREEIFEPEDAGEPPKYGSWDDEVVEVTVDVEHDGEEFQVRDTFNYYQNPTDRTAFGQYVNKYGAPAKGQDVKVDFDDDGNATIRGIRED